MALGWRCMKSPSLGSKKPRPKMMDQVCQKLSNKARSNAHEERLEGVVRSKRTPNSGARPEISKKGDLQDDLFVWQAKLTEKDRFTITSDVLVELKRQSSLLGKFPAMAITIEGLPSHLEKDLVAVPASVFREMLDAYLKETC